MNCMQSLQGAKYTLWIAYNPYRVLNAYSVNNMQLLLV